MRNYLVIQSLQNCTQTSLIKQPHNKKVYKELFDTEKIDIPASEIYNSWNDSDRREAVFRYSIEDTKAIYSNRGKDVAHEY